MAASPDKGKPASAAARKTPKAAKPMTPSQVWKAQPGSIADLCQCVISGGNLWQYTQTRKLAYATISDWIAADPERADKYARAREDRADKLADEIVAISDEVNVSARHDGESVTLALDATAVARNRLRVDARKWVAAKLKPRKYGDKLALGGDADAPPIQSASTVTIDPSEAYMRMLEKR